MADVIDNEELKNNNTLVEKILDKGKGFTLQQTQYIWEHYIPVQKIKDKIRHYQELQDNYIKKYDEINEGLQAMINVLQELIEESEEN